MRNISTQNFSEHFINKCSNKCVEAFVIIDILLGIFMKNDITKIAYYLLSIAIQFYVLLKAIKMNMRFKFEKGSFLYAILIILLIAIDFAIINVEIVNYVNRIGVLLSVFGLIIIGEEFLQFDIEFIVRNFIRLFIVLITVVNLDAIRFMLTGEAIWKPISYLGYRYGGPFYDPNFMALYSATVFLICMGHKSKSKFQKFAIVMLAFNILLSGALTTFILLPTTFVIHIVSKKRRIYKNIYKKQLVIVCIYFIILIIYAVFNSEVEDIGISILEKVYGDINSATVKYRSLEYRFITQINAMKIGILELLGQGPLQLVSQLGRDTHNSYIGFFFEQGVFGILLILYTTKNAQCNAAYINYVSTYLMLSALLLNIHYTSIYSFFLIIQCLTKNKNYCNPKVISIETRWLKYGRFCER